MVCLLARSWLTLVSGKLVVAENLLAPLGRCPALLDITERRHSERGWLGRLPPLVLSRLPVDLLGQLLSELRCSFRRAVLLLN